MNFRNLQPLGKLRARLFDPDDLPLKLAWLFAALAALYLVWCCKYPPFIDAANVAYTGEVMHDLWRGGIAYSKWHAFRTGVFSHRVFYGGYHCLRYVFAPVTAIKILSSMGVLALPLAMLGLLRSMKQSAWLGLPYFALAFNTNLNMGYLPFVIGIPLIPLALMLIEQNAATPRPWRWVLLGAIVLVSPCVHYFLTAILLPVATLWTLLCVQGRSRLWVLGVTLGVSSAIGVALIPRGPVPRILDIVQWVPYAEHWAKFDRDVLQWTTDGAPALSFPWLLLAFVATLVTTRKTPVAVGGLRALSAPFTALALFLGYVLGPTYISWPEPAWGFETRVGIALALMLPLITTTSAVGWRRFRQYTPWVAFTIWHLAALVGPFRAYDAATRPLSLLVASVPNHSTILPVVGSEWMKGEGRYSFGGFTGFVFRHVGNWVAVETQSYQPWSFCDTGYHPIRCVGRLGTPRDRQPASLTPDVMRSYDFLLVQDNAPHVQRQLRALPIELVRSVGQWSLWRPLRKLAPGY
jgi:hypothetical protein